MIDDHAERTDRLQRALAEAWLQRPEILNVPGRSLACKIDPFYYLALHPGFLDFLAKAGGMFRRNVAAALVRTGNLLTAPRDKSPAIRLHLLWGDAGEQNGRLDVNFIHNSFIDRGLKLYARREEELPISGLRVHASERETVARFLEGKTELQALAFGE